MSEATSIKLFEKKNLKDTKEKEDVNDIFSIKQRIFKEFMNQKRESSLVSNADDLILLDWKCKN